ncbi:MAG TPA: acylphosphatase [Solirubrobacteraceae bacterium]|jgi:acylphosphatase
MVERRRVLVSGRVQGVFFRDSVSRRAREAGLSGWVRNLEDGRVEAVLEGPAAAVERVVAFCRTGPPRARVDEVEERAEEPEGLAGFSIRR